MDAVEENRFFSGGAPAGSTRLDLVEDASRIDLGLYAGWRRPVRLRGELSVVGRLDWVRRDAAGEPSRDPLCAPRR